MKTMGYPQAVFRDRIYFSLKIKVIIMSCRLLLRSAVVMAVLGLSTFVTAGSAEATYIRSAVNVVSSTGDAVPVANLSNQSGLESNFVSGVTDFDAYNPGNVLHDYPWGNEWFAPLGSATGSLVFDLGYKYTIDRFAFWNEDSGGIAEIVGFSSLDGVSWSPSIGTFTPTDNTLNMNYVADVFEFPAIARYVRFDLTATDPTDQGYAPTLAIGEVAFSVAEPVPEPATMLLFGAGLGVLGVFRGRKRKES